MKRWNCITARFQLKHNLIAMPVVIKELHVKVNVEEDRDRRRSTQRERSSRDHDALIDACVEKVMEILNQKDRR